MFKSLWEGWKRLAHRIGNFQARLILTLLYLVVVLPFGLATWLFSDPLRIRKRPEGWLDHQVSPRDPEWARRQW
jgi:hypothetical protein